MGKTLPSVVSCLGHALTLAWLVGLLRWEFALIGLACDFLDGFLARRLRAESRFGSLYDWTIDITSLVLVLAKLRIELLALVLIPFAVFARLRAWHFSGRAAFMLILIGIQIGG